MFPASKGKGRYLFWTPWLGKVHTRVFVHLQSAKGATKRRGRSICLSGGKRCAVGRDTWLAGLSFLILLTHSAKFEEDAYWLESYRLLIFWGKFGGGISAGLHFCFCFPPMYHMRLSFERSIAAAPYGCGCLLLAAAAQKRNIMELSSSIPGTPSTPKLCPLFEYFLSSLRELLLAGIICVFIMRAKSKGRHNHFG